jgi:hypothetical protein
MDGFLEPVRFVVTIDRAVLIDATVPTGKEDMTRQLIFLLGLRCADTSNHLGSLLCGRSCLHSGC